MTFRTFLECSVTWQKNKFEAGTAFLCVCEIISITKIAKALRDNPSLKSYLFNSGHSHARKIIFTVILHMYYQEMMLCFGEI